MLDIGDGHDSTGRCAETPRASPRWCCTAAPARAASPGTGGMFDPARYRVVLLDQRGCGRSTPHAGDPGTASRPTTTRTCSTTSRRLRELLGIDRWLVWGGSFGLRAGARLRRAAPAAGHRDWCCGASPTGHRSRGGLAVPRRRGRDVPRAVAPVAAAARGDRRRPGRRATGGCWTTPTRPCAHGRGGLVPWESATPDWPPRQRHRRALPRSRVRARLRTPGHPLRAPRPLDRGRPAAPRRRPAGRRARRCWCTAGSTCRRRCAAAWDLQPGAARRHAGGRRRGRPCRGRRRQMRDRLVAATDRFAGV